jgi:DNA primase small subunit
LIDFDHLKEASHQHVADGNRRIAGGSRIISDATKSETYHIFRRAFREYYFKHGKNIESPTEIKRREFAFRYLGSKGEPARMVRHLAFGSVGEILATALREVPSDVYCSNGYYRFPTYPMQEKDWLGADLIFDIDTKDLNLPCKIDHSYFICESCSQVTKNKKQGLDKCRSCNSQNLALESTPCEICIDGAKKEVRKLLLMLTEDFGIVEKDIRIYFSGNDGFHLYVTDPNFQNLDAQARSDMTGYILGKGLLPETIGVYRKIRTNKGQKMTNNVPEGDTYNYSARYTDDPRIIHSKYQERENSQNNFLVKFPRSGLKYGWRKRLYQQLGVKDPFGAKLKNIVQQRGGYYNFKIELDKIGKELGVNIDPQVTMDIHRVFRMPGTLNSKSGLTKMRCTDLDSFNPLYDACLLSDAETKVKIKTPVKLTLKGQTFKIDETITSLPTYAAIYLVCKNLAIMI